MNNATTHYLGIDGEARYQLAQAIYQRHQRGDLINMIAQDEQITLKQIKNIIKLMATEQRYELHLTDGKKTCLPLGHYIVVNGSFTDAAKHAYKLHKKGLDKLELFGWLITDGNHEIHLEHLKGKSKYAIK